MSYQTLTDAVIARTAGWETQYRDEYPLLSPAQREVIDVLARRPIHVGGAIATNSASLVTLLEAPGTTQITLGASITVASAITIPLGVEIIPGPYLFIQGGGGSIRFDGELTAGRHQVFDGFTAGQIKGNFGGGELYPEWWGLVGTTINDGEHEIAINCAIQCFESGDPGNVVSLGSRFYYVSGEIDLRDCFTALKGTGAGRSVIEATTNWSPTTWYNATFWDSLGLGADVTNGIVDGNSSHAWMILMGSTNLGGGADYMQKVEGVTVNGSYAVRNNTSKRISLIGGPGWAQEQHIIRDVRLERFTGFAVGWHHPDSSNILNGVTLEKFWIAHGMRRGTVPIFISPQSYVFAVRDGTIDNGPAGKAQTAAWSVAPADPEPDYIEDWALIGIYAAGAHSVIDNVHIEGVNTAIHCYAWAGPSSVSISNIDTNHLMDVGMVYFNDEDNYVDGPADPESDYFEFATIVSIGRQHGEGPQDHHNGNVSVKNLRSQGICKFVIRDQAYDVNLSSYGHGNLPNTAAGTLTRYDRGVPYGLSSSGAWPAMVAGDYYDPDTPPVDRTYFDLIH